MDMHHRCPHAHPGDHGLEAPLVFAVIMGDVGGGAAHVKTDNREPAHRSGLHHADHPAGRTRKHASLPRKRGASVKPPFDCMNISLWAAFGAAQLSGHLVDIAPENRREIGIDHRGVASGHSV